MPMPTSTQNAHIRRSYSHAIVHMACVFSLFASGIVAGLPSSTWASVYTCVDGTGKTVLTNRTTGFKNCHILLESATGESKSGSGKKSKNASQPTDDGMPSSFTDPAPPPMEFPNDPLRPWMSSPPGDTSSAQPCAPGFNPLNPMSTTPCPQSDEPPTPGSGQPR